MNGSVCQCVCLKRAESSFLFSSSYDWLMCSPNKPERHFTPPTSIISPAKVLTSAEEEQKRVTSKRLFGFKYQRAGRGRPYVSDLLMLNHGCINTGTACATESISV